VLLKITRDDRLSSIMPMVYASIIHTQPHKSGRRFNSISTNSLLSDNQSCSDTAAGICKCRTCL